MTPPIRVLAICGSTRAQSANHDLIRAIAALAGSAWELDLFSGLTRIPHFNPDLDKEGDDLPGEVSDLRQRLRGADAVLICSPEYAIGVPGTLKNAIDWTVSSLAFSGKPVALITASTSGYKAHASLLGTLLIIESRISPAMQLVIPGIKTKVSGEGKITHPETLDQVNLLIAALARAVHNEGQDYLSSPGMT